MSTPLSLQDGERFFAVVCDGHGGSDYMRSNIGSSLAAQAAVQRIYSFLDTATLDMMERDAKRQLRYLVETILDDWRQRIKRHLEQHPFTDEELNGISERAKKRYKSIEDDKFYSAYGTTMIAVGYTTDFWFGVQIGDGKCVVVDKKGNFFQPIPWDEKCFLNSTTSICDNSAIHEFRYHYSKEMPAAIFVGTDGIDGCFVNDEKLYNLYKTLLYSINESGLENTVQEFEDYLPRMSAQGSGDDVSIAAIIDIEAIKELSGIKEHVEQRQQEIKEMDNK